jgi:hypothetical protein
MKYHRYRQPKPTEYIQVVLLAVPVLALQVSQCLRGLGVAMYLKDIKEACWRLGFPSALEAAAAAGAEDILKLLLCCEGWCEQRAWESALGLPVINSSAGAARLLLTAVGRVCVINSATTGPTQ